MDCPNLVKGKIKMCDSEMFDGMVPNLSELKEFCESGEYNQCPFFIGSKMPIDKNKIRHSTSDWNVFHKVLAGY